MNSLQDEFASQVDFLGVYISEAHASDEWPLGVKYIYEQPKEMETRLSIANGFVNDFKFNLPMLVDTMENQFDSHFAAWPERFYIVKNNTLILVGEPTTDLGFDRDLLRRYLVSALDSLQRDAGINESEELIAANVPESMIAPISDGEYVPYIAG